MSRYNCSVCGNPLGHIDEACPRCLPNFYSLRPKVEVKDKDAEIARLMGEVERLNAWVNDLQSGMYINCVYCGHCYGPQDKVPRSMADALKKHIEQCPKHPASKLKSDLAAAKQESERLAVKLSVTAEGERKANAGWCDAKQEIERLSEENRKWADMYEAQGKRLTAAETRLSFRGKVTTGVFCDGCAAWEQEAWEARQKVNKTNP